MNTEWTDADDALLAFHALPSDHPVKLTRDFFDAADDPQANRELLKGLVTPESLRYFWREFETAARLAELPFSINTSPRIYPSAPDVAYVLLMDHRPEPGRIEHGQKIAPLLMLTWIWRPELGGWKLHTASLPPGSAPELVPRTSPGTAPDINAQPLRHAV